MADITPATFTTQLVRVGRGGVNLTAPLDALTLEELSRLSNWLHVGGELHTRPGLTLHTVGLPGTVHSIRRATAPDSGLTRLFLGSGTDWIRAADGGGADVLEGGFSGDPLTMIPIRKPLASGSWMLVADRLKMRKAGLASTGSLSIGLPAPGVAPTVNIAFTYTTPIAAFQASDGTQAAAWTGFAELDDTSAASSGVPTMTDVVGVNGGAVAFQLNPGTATAGYQSAAALPKALDLSVLGGGGPAATDDDLIHVQLRLADPLRIREVRIYLVCSPFSNTASVPGTHPTENVAAYVHAFLPSDYAAFIGGSQSAADAVNTATGASLLEDVPVAPGRWKSGDLENPVRLPIHPTTTPTTQGGLGANVWQEFSRIGLPVRRSDFIPIGTAGQAGTDWSTITGIYLLFWTTDKEATTVSLDDLYLTGGNGPDTTEPGAQKYDYRYTHRDLRTGARGNGSPVMAEALWIDSQRQSIVVDPNGRGDPYVRQDIYRRGGTLTDNWYFVGSTASDGGSFVDTLSDADIAAAETLPTDNYQPVPTLDDNGNTVLNQPVPVVFGPFDDGVFCALGDPYRPGHLYSCIPGDVDAWPASGGFIQEVCAPSEELMNGCVWGGGGWVFSRERGYTVSGNPSAPGIVVTPTECKPGLAARWGFCHGMGAIFYVARDGVRMTGGGESVELSEAVRRLFLGETVNGRAPVDFAVPTAIRLALIDSELWFAYQDTSGTRQVLVYSLLYKYWRFVDFASATPATAIYADESVNTQPALRLLIGSTTGSIYRHTGFTDAGVPISCSWRTGAWFADTRGSKLLGDVVLDADLGGAAVTLLGYLDGEAVVTTPLVIPTTVGRDSYVLQPFSPTDDQDPPQATSVALELSLLAPLTQAARVYRLGVGAAPLPEITTDRVVAWGTYSSLSDKYLKGFLLDANTYGAAVELDLAVDGVYVRTITATHAGRRVANYTFPQVLGRVFQLTPRSGMPTQVYTLLPIFDEEPYALARWETQLLDFNLPGSGWGSVLAADLCYRARVDSTLTIDCFSATGTFLATVSVSLPSTNGAKQKIWRPFVANKGVLFKLVFATTDASEGLTLYQEESRLLVQPWGGPLQLQKPFGNDDTGETRNMTNAVIAAEKPGGGS